MNFAIYFVLILIVIFLIATLYIKPTKREIKQNPIEEYRKQAIGTINHLKYVDYDETPALKKYYPKPQDIRNTWRNIPEEYELNMHESTQIFDTPIKYSGVSPKQFFLEWGEKKIYITESNQLSDIIEILIQYSHINQDYFGAGTTKLNSLLIEKFKILFPNQISTANGLQKLFNDELDYYQHIINHLKREYLMLIVEVEYNSFLKLIIPLFRTEKDEEYIGGLLHLLQHLQVNGNPISAKNKTQKGDTEFYSDLLFTNIIEAFFKVVEQNKNIQNSGPVNFHFINSQGVRIKGGFFYNSDVDVWFINSIMQK